MDRIRQWFKRYLSDPQVVSLAVVLLGGFVVVLTLGRMIAPLLAALVVAYLLDGLITALHARGVPRTLAVTIVFILFLIVVIFMLLVIFPRLSRQLSQLVQQLPRIVGIGQDLLMQLPQKYPALVSQTQLQDLIDTVKGDVLTFGQRMVSMSLASVIGFITIMVYLFLVPVLVFFMLKDKLRIIDWFMQYLPRDRALTGQVWYDVNRQIGNYVRGKIWEILIVGGVSYVTFVLMQLDYPVLLATLVGLSVVVPYIGAAIVTLPILAIAYFQWGWSAEFGYLVIAYGIIQALDGNLLVPLLFSEVVNLHPIAIIVAVLVFGGLWGFWGVFFAIPLATLVQAVLKAWPRKTLELPAPG